MYIRYMVHVQVHSEFVHILICGICSHCLLDLTLYSLYSFSFSFSPPLFLSLSLSLSPLFLSLPLFFLPLTLSLPLSLFLPFLSLFLSILFRKDDYCLIKPHNQDVVHESVVHYVQRESVIIKITKTAKEAW